MAEPHASPDFSAVLALVAAALGPHIEAAVARAIARSQPPPAPLDKPTRGVSVAEAARQLSIHPRTVRRMVDDGRLRAVRTGSGGSARVLVLRESLDALLGAGET